MILKGRVHYETNHHAVFISGAPAVRLRHNFHTRGNYSNMSDEEQKAFSTMLDGMKQDMDKKNH